MEQFLRRRVQNLRSSRPNQRMNPISLVAVAVHPSPLCEDAFNKQASDGAWAAGWPVHRCHSLLWSRTTPRRGVGRKWPMYVSVERYNVSRSGGGNHPYLVLAVSALSLAKNTATPGVSPVSEVFTGVLELAGVARQPVEVMVPDTVAGT